MIFDVEKIKARETYNLLIGLVAPRPIALVTSMNEEAEWNSAPFSLVQLPLYRSPIIGMGVMNRPASDFVPKDTAAKYPADGGVCGERGDRGYRRQQMNICATDFPAGV